MKPKIRRTLKLVGHAWHIGKGGVSRYLIRQSTGPRPGDTYQEVERLVYAGEGAVCLHCLSQNYDVIQGSDKEGVSTPIGLTCRDCKVTSYYKS